MRRQTPKHNKLVADFKCKLEQTATNRFLTPLPPLFSRKSVHQIRKLSERPKAPSNLHCTKNRMYLISLAFHVHNLFHVHLTRPRHFTVKMSLLTIRNMLRCCRISIHQYGSNNGHSLSIFRYLSFNYRSIYKFCMLHLHDSEIP